MFHHECLLWYHGCGQLTAVIIAQNTDSKIDLAVLSVHPSHQRKGVGKKLLQWGMERAAEENKPVFLLSSPEGYPLYLSQGFRTLKEFMLCGTLPSFSMIWSSPGSAEGAGSI